MKIVFLVLFLCGCASNSSTESGIKKIDIGVSLKPEHLDESGLPTDEFYDAWDNYLDDQATPRDRQAEHHLAKCYYNMHGKWPDRETMMECRRKYRYIHGTPNWDLIKKILDGMNENILKEERLNVLFQYYLYPPDDIICKAQKYIQSQPTKDINAPENQ